jgi:hypothetical protein
VPALPGRTREQCRAGLELRVRVLWADRPGQILVAAPGPQAQMPGWSADLLMVKMDQVRRDQVMHLVQPGCVGPFLCFTFSVTPCLVCTLSDDRIEPGAEASNTVSQHRRLNSSRLALQTCDLISSEPGVLNLFDCISTCD